MGERAMSPLLFGGPQRFKVGDEVEIGAICGRIGYVTIVVWRVTNASHRKTKSEVGAHVGRLAMPPLPFGGSPMRHSGGTK